MAKAFRFSFHEPKSFFWRLKIHQHPCVDDARDARDWETVAAAVS